MQRWMDTVKELTVTQSVEAQNAPVLAAPSLPAGTPTAAAGTPDAEAGALNAPVVAVTLFEDRAQVTRRALVSLTPGIHTLHFSGVTPLAVDSSLNATASSSRITVIDVKLTRGVVKRFPHVDVKALVAERDAAQDKFDALVMEENKLTTRLNFQQRWIEDARRRVSVAAPRGQSPTALFQKLDVLADDALKYKQQILSNSQEKLEMKERLGRINAALSNAGRPTEERFQATLQVVVDVSGGGDAAQDFSLEVQYTTPCALWRPEHDARLDSSEAARQASGATLGRVRFDSLAVIWQATGEDWDRVKLSCSTARPGRISSPPLLSDDILSARRKVDPRTVVAEVREEQIQTSGDGAAATTADMPGVDDGGEAQLFTVSQPVTVKSDGKPVRAGLASFDCAASGGYVCMPEKLPVALLRAELSNQGGRPILAGPVVLYRDGGYVGRSKVGFVAPGEKFKLSFGSLSGVRVHRTQAVKREETRLTGYQTYTIQVSLALSNLSDEKVVLELVERIPVSELEEVKVSLLDRSVGKLDGDGMVTQSLTLSPRSSLTRELGFKVEAPSRVILPYHA